MSRNGRLTLILALSSTIACCGKTGHLAEVTIKPGVAVTGKRGHPVSELPTAEQGQLATDIQDCVSQATVTVPDDQLALNALLGAASGVLAAHGTAARFQGGINGATDAMNQDAQSTDATRQELIHAAEWNASDCLKRRGWDSMPRFMYH